MPGRGGLLARPRAVRQSRLEYNEAIKSTGEQQLLLNIVRLRYGDVPSSLAVTAVAEQRELTAGLRAVPFFTSAAAGDVGGYRGLVLPQAELSGSNRPTLTYSPSDDSDFTRRLFTPVSLDGLAYLSKTTWPIETVFRLYRENLNWVPNAETASGPTPRLAPRYAEFRAGVAALQRLRDRNLAVLTTVERDDKPADAVKAGAGSASAVEAVKAGFEYRADERVATPWSRSARSPCCGSAKSRTATRTSPRSARRSSSTRRNARST